MQLLILFFRYLGMILGWATGLAELSVLPIMGVLWEHKPLNALWLGACAVVYFLVRILWILERISKKIPEPLKGGA